MCGILKGYDDYVNMVLDDVTEYSTTTEGKHTTRLDSILLNGHNIAILVPGGSPTDAAEQKEPKKAIEQEATMVSDV